MADKGAWPRSMLLEFSNALARKTFMCECGNDSQRKIYVLWNQKPGSSFGPHCRKRVAVVRVAAIGAGPEVCFIITAVDGVSGRTAACGGNADECLWMGG